MRARSALIGLLVATFTSPTALAADDYFATLKDLAPVTLRSGVNRIACLTADGREGIIVVGHHEYITAVGMYNSFLVLTPSGPTWNNVTFGHDQTIGPDDPISFTDRPHVGEDMVRSVRFAWASIGGTRVFLAFVAERSFVIPIPSPSQVTISAYELSTDSQIGADIFVLKGVRRSAACYGHADLALRDEIGLELPEDYAGPRSSSDCASRQN